MAEDKAASDEAACSDYEYFSASEDGHEDEHEDEMTPERLATLVKQVEFYFSDANLPTDKKLLRLIRAKGFVPVKLFSNLRKVRAISKDVATITRALKMSTLLELSLDARGAWRVARIAPVPKTYDIEDIQRRTVIVYNPPGRTIESVTEVFSRYGPVKLVRICTRQEANKKLPNWLTDCCKKDQPHAYVEFEKEEGATLAYAALEAERDTQDETSQVERIIPGMVQSRGHRSGGGGARNSMGGAGGMAVGYKGSRDTSPLGARAAGSRRGSGGGAPHGYHPGGCLSPRHPNGSFTNGSGSAGLWKTSPQGGATVESSWRHPPSPYHQPVGAFDQNVGSRRGSGGGCGYAAPPPPPPPRRSFDCASSSELASSASVCPPSPAGLPSRQNIYLPPSKRPSDGHGNLNNTSSGGSTAAPVLLRSCADSFNSSCGGSFNSSRMSSFNSSRMSSFNSSRVASSTASVSAVSTPTAVACPFSPVSLTSPPPPPAMPTAVPSSLLSSRCLYFGCSKSAAHPPVSTPHAVPISDALLAAIQAEKLATETGAKDSSVVRPSAEPFVMPTASCFPMVHAPRSYSHMSSRSRSAGGAVPEDEEAIAPPRLAINSNAAFPATADVAFLDDLTRPRKAATTVVAAPASPAKPSCDAASFGLGAPTSVLDVVSEGEDECECDSASNPVMFSDVDRTATVVVHSGTSAHRSTAPGALPTAVVDLGEICSIANSPITSPREMADPTGLPPQYTRSCSSGAAPCSPALQHEQQTLLAPGGALARRRFVHGAGGVTSPTGFGRFQPAAFSLLDGGAPASTGHAAHAAIHVRGPDGSRGFAGRRALAA